MAALPDRAPPEIEPGVTIASLTTMEDCDRALDGLTRAIVQIERQLATTPRNSPNQPVGWRPNAEAALRIKKFLLPRVQERRAEVKREVREGRQATGSAALLARAELKRRHMIRLAWEVEPEAMARVQALAHQRFPDLFTAEGEAA